MHERKRDGVGDRSGRERNLPAETPDVAVLYPAEMPPGSFYPHRVGAGGQSKQWRDLRVGDALADAGVTDAQAGGRSTTRRC